jgi:hypothetical protein
VGIIIEDIRYLDKFRPAETDVDWSLYNIGEPYDLEIDYRVEEVVVSDAENSTDGVNTIILEPSPSLTGIADSSDLIWCNNPNAFANFHVGDVIEIIDAKKAASDGTYTITEKIDDSAFRTTGGYASGFLKKGGTIHVVTPFKGHRYLFNWIENNAATQYIEVESQEENKLYYDNTTTALGATSMLWSGNGTNQIEGATIEGNGTTTYGQRFTIKHSGVVTPFFLAAQLVDTQARLKPDYFEAGECLKHVFKLEVNRDLSNPNDTQEIIYDERLGNTGWFNENYNGQDENYTLSNLLITRVSDATTLNALELSSQVDVTFTVSNTVDSPFRSNLTKGMSLFYILPDLEANYQNNSNTLKENFVYDYALNTEGTITNGNNYGTTLQAIEETEITYAHNAAINVRIRFDFGSLAQSIINVNDFKRYLFAFTIENHTLTRETSDKTTLLLDVNEFYIELFNSNLITNNTGFLFHRYTDYVDSITSPEVFPVDDMVASSQFSIDFNGLTADGIDILNVSHELVLTHATNADILVESNSYNTSGSTLLDGYVPLIDIEQNRAFTIADNDFRKLVTIQRDSANDTGTTFAYQTSYPFFVRWETWEALSVSNPPSGVYDSSLPNNGLNNFLYRYSTEGYTLNYRLRFTILQNGEQFTQEFDTPLTMYDFDSNVEWNNEYIKSYDVSTSTELTSGGDKFLQGYTDTRLEAAFDKTVGTLPLLADIDIVFWIIGKEKGTIKSVKRASSFYSTSGDTWFKGITSNELVNKTKVVSLYEGKVLVDFTKLSGSEFTVYARIHDNVSGIPLTGKLLEDGTLKLLEDTTTKIIE